jgi:hypothetical protein
MTTVFESFTMDYTSSIEHAQRADGQWFTRSQYRDPRYGYKWTAWRKTTFLPERARPNGKRNVRLPND